MIICLPTERKFFKKKSCEDLNHRRMRRGALGSPAGGCPVGLRAPAGEEVGSRGLRLGVLPYTDFFFLKGNTENYSVSC